MTQIETPQMTQIRPVYLCHLWISSSVSSVERGFTLIEILLGSMTLAIALAALLGAFLSQITLNEHGRNLTLTVHDANRVVEELRRANSPCGGSVPSASASGAFTSWNAWLQDTSAQGGGGKSLPSPNPTGDELVVVTCQDRNGANYCGSAGTTPQVDTEWNAQGATTTFDPIRVTVSVCWRHRERVIGECTWNGAALTANDADGDGVIESPAMLTTLVTCRG
jgi:type II secretory pathway pseudopilin PulG